VDACVLAIAERYQSRLPLSKVACRLIDTLTFLGSLVPSITRVMEALSGLEILILSLLISFALLYKLITSLRYRNALRRHRCRSVASYPHKDPFLGYDLYRIIERSRQQNNAVLTLQWLFDSYGNGKTFQALTWGIPTIYSVDSRIIRAVLKEKPHNSGVEAFQKPFNGP